MTIAHTRVQFACRIARQAGALLRERFGRLASLGVTKKGAVDLLTEADRASEALIVGRLLERFPGDAVLAEEGGSAGATSSAPFTWVVDPLDGTTNYVHSCRRFAVSIGLVSAADGPIAGVVAAPAEDTLWYGTVADGAAFEVVGEAAPKLIGVSSCVALSEALVATGFPYDRRDTAVALLEPVRRALQQTRGVRRMGAAALDFVDVARGAFDGFFEPRLAPWDMAAGVALVRAAGGVVTAYEGARFELDSSGVIAAGPGIHDALVALVAGGAGS